MFSYSGDPADSTRDQVRFLVQDADEKRQLLQDEEIDWLLTEHPNPHVAAADAALVISTRFSSLPDRVIGGLKISYGNVARYYLEIATRLRRKAARMSPGAPIAGGLTVRQLTDRRGNTDLDPPWTYLNQQTHNPSWNTVGFWGTALGNAPGSSSFVG